MITGTVIETVTSDAVQIITIDGYNQNHHQERIHAAGRLVSLPTDATQVQ